ncbi:MAG: hypothetical protein IT236_13260 [Bacteroidia bacterium]|nr:hypothetical protein [Bacteroidia bacterium]
MKKTFLTFTAVILNLLTFGQTESDLQNIATKTIEKAIIIYDLESAAWIANDSIMMKPNFEKKSIESYVSFKMGDRTICVFYSKSVTILAEFVFVNKKIIKSVYNKRAFTQDELSVVKIKRSVQSNIKDGTIKKFKIESGTTYNLIPIVIGNENFCYLINVVNSNTKTILGRDCTIKLDSNYNIIDTKYNHKSIQELPFKIEGIKAFYHTHVLDDFFSETEIATTMLYKNYLPTDQFIVMGKKYTSTWNSTTRILTIK